MVATHRMARASTSAQRTRRVVARATPQRPKRSRSVSTISATRDASGLSPRTRARRAVLTTAADPTPLRRSLSHARSSSDRGPSLDTPLASRQLFQLRRVAVDPAPVPADLTQWRQGILDRLPRLNTVPRNYADLRAFLQAVELAIHALDRPADAFHISMQQLHPRLQAHIRTCMTAQPDPTRTPYDHMVAILIQQVAPGKPEDYLHETIALIARRADTQISRLHMQFTEAYDAYRDLCARLRSPPHLGEHFVVTAILGNLPKDIARDTRNQASAADRLNDLQYVARLAINFDTLARTHPGRGEQRPQDANTLTLNDDFYAPPASADPPADTTPTAPLLAHERPAPQAPQQPSVAVVKLHPGATDAQPAPPDTADLRPTPPPPADPPAAQRAVFCAAPPAPGALAPPPAICNHTRLGTPPRTPNAPTHTRSWAAIDGIRCEAIIDTGADLSLISADVLRPHRCYQPGAPAHGSVTGVNNHTLQVLGRVALDVRLGPLKTTAPFFVVPGVAFAALLGVDFLYEHGIAAVREAVAELDAPGITEPSTGCWSTPIVMVRKASGAWRLCCGYRAINKHVPTPQQPLPRTDNILASFNGKKYFSVLDMCKGFYQIGIAEEDRPKTSFVTPDCQRQCRSLPFGFASSPAIFQRKVNLLLGGMKWVSAVGYLDDIIVYSDAWDAHRAHLRQLFQALRDANLQLHPGKCSFGAAAVRYLGHIVSRDGIKPCPSKVQAILEMPVPKTAKAVQRFLGKCQYYQPYDEGERVVAYASRSLLDHERKWTATELEAAALIWALETFRHYIDTIEVCIRTDHAPLEYIRHNSSQCRRLERWALRLQEFRFKVIHRPGAQQKHVDCLSRAPVPPTPSQQPIVLDEFPFRGVLHARAEHPAPPALSILWCAPLCAAVNHVAHSAHRRMRLLRHRLRHMCAAAHAVGTPVRPTPGGSDDDTDVQACLTDSDDESPAPPMAQLPDNVPPKVVHGGRNIPLPPAVEHLSLKDAQAQDPECQEFLRLARTPRAAWPPHLRHTPLQFCVLHDLVYVRIGDALPRVVQPAIFRSRAIQAHHLSCYGGHFGVLKTAARLACRGNNHILIIIDHHTRWVELVPLPNPTAAQVAQALFNEWISRWGVPRALLSDNGPQFTAELLRQLCTTLGISKLFESPYNPRGNSIVESYMRSLKTTLRLCLQHFRQEWDIVLPAAALAYRCTPHSVTRFSPFFLGPYVVERVLPTGTTAELVDPVSGTKILANRARLKFLDAPQPSDFTQRLDVCTKTGSETREQPQSKQFTSRSGRHAKTVPPQCSPRYTLGPGRRGRTWWKLSRHTVPTRSRPCNSRHQQRLRPRPPQPPQWPGSDNGQNRQNLKLSNSRPWAACSRRVRGMMKKTAMRWVEARPALPTPASGGVSAELEGSAELSPLPAPKAPGSGRAAPQTAPSSPAAPPPGEPAGQGPPSPLSPVAEGTVSALSHLASQEWDLMTTRCVWWTLTAAREYRTAKENFEHRMQVDNMSRTVTGARTMLANLPQGQSSVAGLVGRLRQEQQRGVTVTEDQVECLVGFWLSSAERLASLRGPGRTSLREFLNGVYRTGQALLGATVATAAPAVPVADPSAPHEPATPVRSIEVDHPSAVFSPPGETTPPPPLPDLSTEEFRLPEPAVATRNPPLQLGMDRLLNGSAGRSPQVTRVYHQLARNRDPQPSSRKQSNPLRNAFVLRGGDVVQLR
ncbi:hypothetical protein Emag_007831 [Eimeria magna]